MFANGQHRENLGKVSFVLESGQPNIDRIRATLEFIQKDESFNIAHVGVASKNAFKQLYAADFLAHSRTSDPYWWEMLHETGNVLNGNLPPNRIRETSERIAKDFGLTRN